MKVLGTGPVEVQAVCDAVLGELAGAVPTGEMAGSREQWAGVLGAAQRVIDVASAVQDAAMVRWAAIEPEVLEDGTVVESHRGLGHAALDTPAMVSGVLNVSAVHAERRVRTALRLAADGPAGSATETGLGGLHAAMATGRLDPYRAGVIAEELAEAPPQVAAGVVAALERYFACEDGAHLRRRCRRLLARISPDLLLQRARRARQQCGLRRWVDEPGVDHWEGTFPSEDAARAWAAIDALARQYLTDGVCPTIDRARAKALTDLVAGHATITTVLTLTVPAAALPAAVPATAPVSDPEVVGGGDLVEVTGLSGSQPVLVSHRWLTTQATATTGGSAVQVAPCHPVTGALLDDTTATQAPHTTDVPDETDQSGATQTRDTTGAAGATDGERGRTPTSADGAAQAAARPDGHAADRAAEAAQAHPDDHAAESADDAAGRYRPSARMARRIRARDRRCRFPGCTIAAVFCDLDHVRPWPNGPTHDDNLLCLCRRHHRIKQRPGWQLTLTPDAVTTWTDPTGRKRTTDPVDALHTQVLTDRRAAPDDPGSATSTSTSRARTLIPDGPHSELEYRLEHHGTTPPGRRPTPVTVWRDHHGRHRTDLQPTPGTIQIDHTGHWPRRHSPTRTRHHDDDDPPPF